MRNMTSDAMNMQINNNVVMCRDDVLCCEMQYADWVIGGYWIMNEMRRGSWI